MMTKETILKEIKMVCSLLETESCFSDYDEKDIIRILSRILYKYNSFHLNKTKEFFMMYYEKMRK